MEKFQIEIRKGDNYLAVEFSENIPCILADKIKKTVEKFYDNTDE